MYLKGSRRDRLDATVSRLSSEEYRDFLLYPVQVRWAGAGYRSLADTLPPGRSAGHPHSAPRGYSRRAHLHSSCPSKVARTRMGRECCTRRRRTSPPLHAPGDVTCLARFHTYSSGTRSGSRSNFWSWLTRSFPPGGPIRRGGRHGPEACSSPHLPSRYASMST